jgi:tRNA (guanine10-N2)-dimethyltransferase
VKLLLELSMECESLARSEAISTAGSVGTRASIVLEEPGMTVIDTDADPVTLSERLALCHCVSEYLLSCTPEDLTASAKDIDVDGPIRVHTTRIGSSFNEIDLERVNSDIGALVGERAGVDIHTPRSEIRIVLSDHASVGRCVGRVDRSSYERRKVRYLPFNQPVSIHPKYARALVNLTRARSGGRVLDPFCGTGAIVLEAALAGYHAIGTDVSQKMIDGAQANLRSQDVEAELMRCDIGEMPEVVGDVAGVATDPPYGRSTSTDGEPLQALLSRALGACADVLAPGSFMAMALHDLGLIDGDRDFEVVETHPLWVHRSLTRHFCVLRRV